MRTIAILVFALIAQLAQAQSYPYYHIDAEFTFVHPANADLYQSNLFNAVSINTFNSFRRVLYEPACGNQDLEFPFIERGAAFKGKAHLAYRWPDDSCGSNDKKDKVMTQVGSHYDSMPGINDWDPASPMALGKLRYTSFALRIPPTNAMPIRPSHWLMLYQAYQIGGNLRPPFAMHIARDGQTESTVDLLFIVRDDPTPTSNQQSGDSENGKQSWTVTVTRGMWYEFIIYQLPRPAGDPEAGRLVVWMAEGDGLPSTSSSTFRVVSYIGSWGYPASGDVTEQLSAQIGLYAGEQPYAAEVHFDEVKFGRQYVQVNP